MSNFDPNAILRGAQLTLVGLYRALQNPGLFSSKHYRQAAIAVAVGVAIRVLVAVPIVGVRIALWVASFFINMQDVQWDNQISDGLNFLEHSLLQIPFLLMTLMRHVTPTLDEMFMDSLSWVDQTYLQKHKSDDPQSLRALYSPNLQMYPKHQESAEPKPAKKEATKQKIVRYGRKAGISLAVLALSYLPYVGRFVLPAASLYTFSGAVGPQPALVIGATSLLFPKRYIVAFLQSYFSSRTLMRELLEPYFSRVHYSKEEKKIWFKDRAGVLFGFSFGFFVLIKIPLVGVLIYGLAEASTAYLITKITEPPLPPAEAAEFKQESLRWKNKQKFLSLPWERLDELNVSIPSKEDQSDVRQTPRKTFS